MLIEYRRLSFPRDDLITAIQLHDKATGNSSLQGALELGAITEQPEISVQLNDAESGDNSSVRLDEQYILAAMIRFCIHQKIPVAQKAEKRVELADGHLALSMTIDQQTSSAPGEEYYILL